MPDNIFIEKNLNKKYCTNVNKLIKAWKKGLDDMEIAVATGLDPATLQRIRQDIELLHRRFRLTQKRETQAKTEPDNHIKK